MKAIGLILMILLTFGCQSNNKKLLEEIEHLKFRNDSLNAIVEEIENKYVFDSISFREIPNRKNDLRLNGTYGLELIVVGYSANKNYFIKYDTIINGQMVRPDTLKQINGGFKFNMKLEKRKNPIKIKMNMENQYGKSEKGNLYDMINVK